MEFVKIYFYIFFSLPPSEHKFLFSQHVSISQLITSVLSVTLLLKLFILNIVIETKQF